MKKEKWMKLLEQYENKKYVYDGIIETVVMERNKKGEVISITEKKEIKWKEKK